MAEGDPPSGEDVWQVPSTVGAPVPYEIRKLTAVVQEGTRVHEVDKPYSEEWATDAKTTTARQQYFVSRHQRRTDSFRKLLNECESLEVQRLITAHGRERAYFEQAVAGFEDVARWGVAETQFQAWSERYVGDVRAYVLAAESLISLHKTLKRPGYGAKIGSLFVDRRYVLCRADIVADLGDKVLAEFKSRADGKALSGVLVFLRGAQVARGREAAALYDEERYNLHVRRRLPTEAHIACGPVVSAELFWGAPLSGGATATNTVVAGGSDKRSRSVSRGRSRSPERRERSKRRRPNRSPSSSSSEETSRGGATAASSGAAVAGPANSSGGGVGCDSAGAVSEGPSSFADFWEAYPEEAKTGGGTERKKSWRVGAVERVHGCLLGTSSSPQSRAPGGTA